MERYGCMGTQNMPESVLQQTSKYIRLGGCNLCRGGSYNIITLGDYKVIILGHYNL